NDAKKPLFNRAISGLYPSGSTIKPIIATAALEEKTISPSKKINDIGYIEIKNKYDPNIVYRRHGIQPHGWVDMRQAIAVSSNIYFYTVGGGYKDQAGLGPTRIKKYLELFGWGSKTRIDLPGEADGFIPSPEWKKQVKKEIWWDGDTYNMSIGQGDILTTPIQMASSFAAIANGGTLYKPQVVKEIVNENKDVVEEIKPEIMNSDFVEPNSLKVVREGMRMAVTAEDAPHASSYSLNFLPVSAAAKTGTAETPGKNVYHNWITVFAPYDNPEIVLTVMLENVPGVQAAALPVARDILQWYFTK
ncbi:MAG: penicillin-binding transpeptidase domain-containing protein, partial [bacterium]|nr:penicillin-binding transpeptidase domain-containing protein [bacterium]